MTSAFHSRYVSLPNPVRQPAGCVLVSAQDLTSRRPHGDVLEFPTYDAAIKHIQARQFAPVLYGQARTFGHHPLATEETWFTQLNHRESLMWTVVWG